MFLFLFFYFRIKVNFISFRYAGSKKSHDAKDDGKAPNRDNSKGSREDINSRLVENCKYWSSYKPDTLGHHGKQGEGGPHLVSHHQLRHNGVGDFLNRPVERKEEADQEEVGEGGAKGHQDHGCSCQDDCKHDQGGVLLRDECQKVISLNCTWKNTRRIGRRTKLVMPERKAQAVEM